MSKRRRQSESCEPEMEEERYFLNPDSVSQHLYCSICQEVFSEPQRAPCGHSFCRKCIEAWLKQSRTCPEDRKPLQKQNMHHDFILENIIGDQMVACPYRRRGCQFVGQLQMLSSHRKNCCFNPSNLPEFLKKDVQSTSHQSPGGDIELDTSDEELPTPAKPSLKMRLFQADGDQRKRLCSMFDNEKETRGSRKKSKRS